ncbi:Uncharacterised protein [Vibrio cholerae]|nr:Uncharacterised protein [Vibrio cholerae]
MSISREGRIRVVSLKLLESGNRTCVVTLFKDQINSILISSLFISVATEGALCSLIIAACW